MRHIPEKCKQADMLYVYGYAHTYTQECDRQYHNLGKTKIDIAFFFSSWVKYIIS